MHRRHAIIAAALAASSLAVTAAPVDAGEPQGLTVEVFPQLPFVRDAATFDFEVATASEACDTSLELTVVDGDEQPVPGATVDVDAGTITFGPAVPGGEYTVVATCTDGQQPLEDEESMLFARGIVDKVVVGTAPEGATFTVAADCEGEGDEEGAPFTAELTFGPTGGSDFFVVYDGQTCEVAETEDGGASDVAVSGDFDFEEPADFTVTVTNTFAAAPTPPAPAPAAAPAVVEPTFTG